MHHTNLSAAKVKLYSMLALDALIWFVAPAVFLVFYIRSPGVSAEVIVPHLWSALIGLHLVCVARIILAFTITSHRLRYRVSSALIALFPIFALLYYPLVIFGLSTWGQVVSWDLLRSYLRQAPQLFEALELSLPLTMLGLSVAVALIVLLVWWYLRRFDWPRILAASPSSNLAAVLLTTGLLVAAAELHRASLFPAAKSDPIAHTFLSRQMANPVAGFVVDEHVVAALDRDADKARSSYAPNPTANRRNLILIVVDALRPDHLEAYGYPRKTTPSLNKTMKSVPSRAVASVRAACGESACGLFSLASSRYAHEISARPFTVQQVLKKHGYEVHMILGGDHQNFYGLRSLYGDVDSFVDGSSMAGAYMNSDQWVLRKTEELPKWAGIPTMIQFHLMSAHPLGSRDPFIVKYQPAVQYALPINKTARTAENMTNFYDNGVVQADFAIGSLLATLKSKAYLDNALVVITADHGEGLGEHGLVGHSNGVRDPVLQVPFILLSFGHGTPYIAPDKFAVSQADIAPTVLHEFGMPLPATWRGTPIQLPSTAPVSYFQQGHEVGLIDHRHYPDVWKYWINVRTGEAFTFNLRTDPFEQHNLVKSMPGTWLDDWRKRAQSTRPGNDKKY